MDIDTAAERLADRPDPTPAQKEAGNYLKGPTHILGMRISIENPTGSSRSGLRADGTEWNQAIAHHYGYIRGTKGKDKDHVDVFLGPDAANGELPVHVIDQLDRDGNFDEHKVMLGFPDESDAVEAYHANYEPGWEGFGAVTALPLKEFKQWAFDGEKTEPISAVVGRFARGGPVRMADGGGVPQDVLDYFQSAGRPDPIAALMNPGSNNGVFQGSDGRYWRGQWEGGAPTSDASDGGSPYLSDIRTTTPEGVKLGVEEQIFGLDGSYRGSYVPRKEATPLLQGVLQVVGTAMGMGALLPGAAGAGAAGAGGTAAGSAAGTGFSALPGAGVGTGSASGLGFSGGASGLGFSGAGAGSVFAPGLGTAGIGGGLAATSAAMDPIAKLGADFLKSQAKGALTSMLTGGGGNAPAPRRPQQQYQAPQSYYSPLGIKPIYLNR